MSKRFPPSRWPLPLVVNPSDSICYCVPVPNDIYHIAAFKGAMFELTKAYSWGNDTAHTAIDAAAVWKVIFDNLTTCPTVQFQQPIPCLLQASFDGGVTWVTIYDGSDCVAQGINDAIDAGTISGGSQPPAGGTGTPGQCYKYKVTLNGNSQWHAPIPVSVGDVITVSNVQGAWYDGAAFPVGPWNCGNGDIFALGVCSGSPSYDGADPCTPAPHMYLIGHIASEPTPYFGMYNGAHNMSSPGPDDFFLQANDSVLADNQGSLTFDVEICINATCPPTADWTAVIDCMAIAGGFSALVGSRVNGVGFQQGETTDSGYYYTLADIVLSLATPVEFIQIDVYYDVTGYSAVHSLSDWISFDTQGPTDRVINQASGNGINKTMAWQGSKTKSLLYINATASETTGPGSGATAHIRTIVICGKGTKPPELP